MSVDILGTSWDQCEAWFSIALRPRKPQGSLGRTAQDGHLDSHTAPELCILCVYMRTFWRGLDAFTSTDSVHSFVLGFSALLSFQPGETSQPLIILIPQHCGNVLTLTSGPSLQSSLVLAHSCNCSPHLFVSTVLNILVTPVCHYVAKYARHTCLSVCC